MLAETERSEETSIYSTSWQTLSFHQVLHPFFIQPLFSLSTTSHFTPQITPDVNVAENQAVWFLSIWCLFWETGRWWLLFATISKPTELPLCAAGVPLFLSIQSCLICLFICLPCYCLLLISPQYCSTFCPNLMHLKYPPCFTLLQTEGGLIRRLPKPCDCFNTPGYRINLNYGQEPISSDLNH